MTGLTSMTGCCSIAHVLGTPHLPTEHSPVHLNYQLRSSKGKVCMPDIEDVL